MRIDFMAPIGRRVLLVCPDGRQFGHLALEWAMALSAARASGASVWLVPPAGAANPALLDVECPDVPLRRLPAVLRPLARLRLGLAGLTRGGRFAADAVVESCFDQLARAVTFHIDHSPLPPTLARHLRGLKQGLGHRTRLQHRGFQPPYFRRRLIRSAIPVALRPEALRRAEALARAAGLPLEGPLVTIHAREAGYKWGGREVHQKPQMHGAAKGYRDDSLRNARIETYGPAIDMLVEKGFTVVRIGDASMTPLRHPGVFDLPASPANDPLLQVYCLLRSRILISGESGPSAASYLAGTALLTVNATDPIGSYPVRASSLFLLKHVEDPARGSLTARDLLGRDYAGGLRNPGRYVYRDNTGEEILLAAYEILERVGEPADADGQNVFRAMATEAADGLRAEFGYVRKWGADGGFLGDGALVRFQADAGAGR